jgi:hypothetical protein
MSVPPSLSSSPSALLSSLTIPPLLLLPQILTEGESSQQNPNEFGTEEYTVYKRGVGNVRIVHSSYEVTEREMSCRSALLPDLFHLLCPSSLTCCRALYQYLLDIPDVIYVFAPEIIQSATTVASLFMTEEMCLIVGALLSDTLKIYLRHSQPTTECVKIVNQLTEKALEALLGLLRFCHRGNVSGTEREQTQVIQIIVDSLRETLRVFAEAKKCSTGWQDISLSQGQVQECLQLLVLEAGQWVERSAQLLLCVFALLHSLTDTPSQELSKR